MKLVTASQMQALDRRTIEEGGIPSRTLMERAGTQVVAEIVRTFEPLKGRRFVVLCGKGHNGGDGFVIARRLAQHRIPVQVLLLHPPTKLAPDTAAMHQRFIRLKPAGQVQVVSSAEQLGQAIGKADVIVDALLGTGLSMPVTDLYRTAIEAMNGSGKPVVAVDLPSGLQADTGAVLGAAVQATLTVTFGLPKCGLYLGAGIDHAGRVHIADIGIPAAYTEAVESALTLLSAGDIVRLLPIRRRSAHKGSFGHAGIIAGSLGKTGAAALAAKAALRVGAGLVTVATPAGVNTILESKLLEAMTVPVPDTAEHTLAVNSLDLLLQFTEAKSALALGPGLTTHPETVLVVHRLLPRLSIPCVVDADGLNAMADHPTLWSACKAPMILTPHPGEMARLAGVESGHAVNRDRLGIAGHFAHTHNVIVALKGARTALAHPDGRLAICPTGNPGMATGGTGDVLTGMIVGLLAQGLPPWDAACAGVFLHGLAGDLAAARRGQAGMIAGDLIEHIPDAFAQVAS